MTTDTLTPQNRLYLQLEHLYMTNSRIKARVDALEAQEAQEAARACSRPHQGRPAEDTTNAAGAATGTG